MTVLELCARYHLRPAYAAAAQIPTGHRLAAAASRREPGGHSYGMTL
jgi:hypothetical protein